MRAGFFTFVDKINQLVDSQLTKAAAAAYLCMVIKTQAICMYTLIQNPDFGRSGFMPQMDNGIQKATIASAKKQLKGLLG